MSGERARAGPSVAFSAARASGVPSPDPLDVVVAPGEHVGWASPGGDALLRAVLRLAPLAGGRILVGERDVRALGYRALQDLRAHSAYVFPQGALAVNATLADNVALPLRYHDAWRGRDVARIVGEALERLGIAAFAEERPAACGEEVAWLAGFARALVVEPTLLLLEAPGVRLGTGSRSRVAAEIAALRARRGSTLVQWSRDERFDVVAPDRIPSRVVCGGE